MAFASYTNNESEANNHADIEITPFVWEIWAVSDYIPFDEETFMPQLTVGDEVWVKKDTAGYSHVTLYIGRGKVVHVVEVDKTGLFPGKTRVAKDSLTSVAKNRLVGLRKTYATKEEQVAIIERALEDVGKLFPYVLTSENCEHQVKYWISGRQDYNMTISTQVKCLLPRVEECCLFNFSFVSFHLCGID